MLERRRGGGGVMAILDASSFRVQKCLAAVVHAYLGNPPKFTS
jgi:hypothetical protein